VTEIELLAMKTCFKRSKQGPGLAQYGDPAVNVAIYRNLKKNGSGSHVKAPELDQALLDVLEFLQIDLEEYYRILEYPLYFLEIIEQRKKENE
jgi:hypothetical protein